MPSAAFIVNVDLPNPTDPSALQAVATEIEAELAGALPLISVAPWGRHADTGPASAIGTIPGQPTGLLNSSYTNTQFGL